MQLIASAALAVAAAVLVVLGEWGAAIPLGVGAVAVLVVGRPAAVPASDLAPLAAMADGLGLEGSPHHLPATPRMFIPATDGSPLPELDERVVYRSTPHALGVAVPSPGAGLYAAWVAHAGPVRPGPEGAAHAIQQAFAHFALARRVRVEAARTRLRVHVEGPSDACVEGLRAGWHGRVGCQACDLAALLAAQALGRPVRLHTSNDPVIVELVA